MKVLLTGGSGFLGRHVLGHLLARGVSVVTVGRRLVPGVPPASHCDCDLLAGDDLAPIFEQHAPTHLLHLAWVTDPATYQQSPLNHQWVAATQRLAQAFCAGGGRRVVVAGSCAEYAWKQAWCDEETTPLAPATAYGVAKDAARRQLEGLCAAHRVECAWARIFFPYGAGQAPQRLIPSLMAALQGQRPPFPVQVLQRRDFVAVADVSSALLTLLASGVRGCINIGSGRPLAVGELLQALARQLDADPGPLLAVADPQAREPLQVAADIRRLRALGWEGPLSLDAGLAQMLGPRMAAPSPVARKVMHGD